MPKFHDIPTVYSYDSTGTDYQWTYFFEYLQEAEKYGFDLYPEFQRDRVWTEQQQIAYIEHILRNGYGGKDIYFNRGSWAFIKHGQYIVGNPKFSYVDVTNKRGKVVDSKLVYEEGITWQGNHLYVCVDGLQRITAAQRFLNNEIPAYGYYYHEYEDRLPYYVKFKVYYGNLDNYADVLQWYLDLNSTGTPHTQEELDRVRKILESYKAP